MLSLCSCLWVAVKQCSLELSASECSTVLLYVSAQEKEEEKNEKKKYHSVDENITQLIRALKPIGVILSKCSRLTSTQFLFLVFFFFFFLSPPSVFLSFFLLSFLSFSLSLVLLSAVHTSFFEIPEALTESALNFLFRT